MRAAVGQIDTGEIRNAGQKLMSDVKSLLMERSGELTNEITSSLKQYFDPQTGLLPQRIQALIQNDGDLEKLLRTRLAPQDSVIAKTLAAHLGEGSPIFRMLSPNEANGLKAQVAGALELALAEQRQHILREFSLDNKDSALARLVKRTCIWTFTTGRVSPPGSAIILRWRRGYWNESARPFRDGDRLEPGLIQAKESTPST